MSVSQSRWDRSRRGAGARTGQDGTPFAVDVSGDRPALVTAAVFLAGPVIWSVHFMLVYLVAEAGCTGDGPGLSAFDPPVPAIVTLVVTAVAAFAAAGCAWWAFRRWRSGRDRPPGQPPEPSVDRGRGPLAFAGFLMSCLSVVTVLLVGLPALVLPSC